MTIKINENDDILNIMRRWVAGNSIEYEVISKAIKEVEYLRERESELLEKNTKLKLEISELKRWDGLWSFLK